MQVKHAIRVVSSGMTIKPTPMSKRLQVLLDEAEFREIQEAARRDRITVSEWVRRSLRAATLAETRNDAQKKRAVVESAVKHSFPVPYTDDILADIEH